LLKTIGGGRNRNTNLAAGEILKNESEANINSDGQKTHVLWNAFAVHLGDNSSGPAEC